MDKNRKSKTQTNACCNRFEPWLGRKYVSPRIWSQPHHQQSIQQTNFCYLAILQCSPSAETHPCMPQEHPPKLKKKIRTHRILLVKLRGSAILNMKHMLPRTLCPNSKPPSSYFSLSLLDFPLTVKSIN